MNVIKRNAWVLLRSLCLSACLVIILSESLVDAKARDTVYSYQSLEAHEIQESIEQLREFENSDLKEKVFELSKAREERRKENPIPESLAERELTAADIEHRERMTAEEKKIYWEKRTKSHGAHVRALIRDEAGENLGPEMSTKVSRVENGKYKVYADFINDQSFPEKYVRRRVFKINGTKDFADKWRDVIFNYYFGENYKNNKPELVAVNDVVIMNFIVSGSDELEQILKDKLVRSLRHAGTPFVVPEYTEFRR